MEIEICSAYQVYQIVTVVNFGFRAAGYKSAQRFTHPTGEKIERYMENEYYNKKITKDECWTLDEAFDYVQDIAYARTEGQSK